MPAMTAEIVAALVRTAAVIAPHTAPATLLRALNAAATLDVNALNRGPMMPTRKDPTSWRRLRAWLWRYPRFATG